MRKKIQSLTLLEVIIALSLTAALLSGIFMTYGHFAAQKKSLNAFKIRELGIERAYQRLLPLFTDLSEKTRFPLHTAAYPSHAENALFFSLVHPLEPDPRFCTELQAILYVDAQHRLCLTLKTDKGVERCEYLLEGVKNCSFTFFHPELKAWQPYWDRTDPLPPFFKITWGFGRNDSITSAFTLPHGTVPIVYEPVEKI